MNALGTKADEPLAPGAAPFDRPAVTFHEVDDASAGQRLDNLLLRLCKGVPKSHVYRLIRSGQVRVNGRRAAAETRLEMGDRVRIPPVRVAEGPVAVPAPPIEYPVVHEDDGLIVIDKPAGVAVHGGSGVASGVIEQLRSARPQARFLELVHRLDRDTSGLLMVAKKRAVLTELQRQLRERQTEKDYLAIVVGRWPKRTKTLDASLRRYLTAEGERRVAVDADGRDAITRVTGIAHGALDDDTVVSLVKCRIETGRTHQIRVHLSDAGFPIVGDDKYGDFALNKRLYKTYGKRMFLHAFKIAVHHEAAGGKLRLRAAVPPEFERLVQCPPDLA